MTVRSWRTEIVERCGWAVRIIGEEWSTMTKSVHIEDPHAARVRAGRMYGWDRKRKIISERERRASTEIVDVENMER